MSRHFNSTKSCCEFWKEQEGNREGRSRAVNQRTRARSSYQCAERNDSMRCCISAKRLVTSGVCSGRNIHYAWLDELKGQLLEMGICEVLIPLTNSPSSEVQGNSAAALGNLSSKGMIVRFAHELRDCVFHLLCHHRWSRTHRWLFSIQWCMGQTGWWNA